MLYPTLFSEKMKQRNIYFYCCGAISSVPPVSNGPGIYQQRATIPVLTSVKEEKRF